MIRRQLTFRTHALQRLFERRINVAEVREVLEHGELITAYEPDPAKWEADWKTRRPA